MASFETRATCSVQYLLLLLLACCVGTVLREHVCCRADGPLQAAEMRRVHAETGFERPSERRLLLARAVDDGVLTNDEI